MRPRLRLKRPAIGPWAGLEAPCRWEARCIRSQRPIPIFQPDGLSLQPADGLMNDVTVVGLTEPQIT